MKKGRQLKEYEFQGRYHLPTQYHCPCCPSYRYSLEQCNPYFQRGNYPYGRFYPPMPALPQSYLFEQMPREAGDKTVIKLEEPDYDQMLIRPQMMNSQFRTENKSKGQISLKAKNYRTKFDPLPLVAFKAHYFDPSVAPPMTSPEYALVQNAKKQKRLRSANAQHSAFLCETDHPEEDANYFILYKFRRIKKKYRKYMKARGMTGDYLDGRSDIGEEDQEEEEQSEVQVSLQREISHEDSSKEEQHNKNKVGKTLEQQEFEQKEKLNRLENNPQCQF